MMIDLALSDDQRMIEDSVQGFLQDRLPVERLREAKNHGGAAERALSQELSDLGMFGLGSAEQDGGLGMGLAEEALAARALGLVLASPTVLAQLASPHFATDTALRAELVSGTARAAFANYLGDGLAHLIDGDEAEQVLLLSPEGAMLLPRNALGEAQVMAGMDETVSLARVSVPSEMSARSAIAERTSLLISGYLTGIAQAATTMAVEYAKTREQFGQPIGAFQAIKHQCADMASRAAAAEAQCFYTAVGFGNGLDDASEIAAARMLATRAGIENAKANIQVHGGMGFTAECDAHLFLKRAHLMALLGTSRAAERQRLLGLAT
jgi:alkylation response protein AidB-like acyl-CoA dehydrogenase